MSEWYISRGNGQEGPMTAKLIAALLARGEFRANDTFAWKEGMPDWKTIAESGVLTEASLGRDVPTKAGPPRPTAIKNPTAAPIKGGGSSLPKPTAVSPEQTPLSAPTAVTNPYAAPAAKVRVEVEESDDYPGIGRRFYVIGFVSAVALILGILYVVTGGDEWEMMMFRYEHRGLFWFMRSTIGVGVLVLTYKRLKNLGMRGWWLLGLMVPFLNVWVFWRMTSCPAGYADHKTLDIGGKIASGVFALMVVFSLFSSVITELE